MLEKRQRLIVFVKMEDREEGKTTFCVIRGGQVVLSLMLAKAAFMALGYRRDRDSRQQVLAAIG